FVLADTADQVYEYTNPAPNLARSATQIAIATGPFADLQPQLLSAPASGSVGETITVNCTVLNTPNASAATPVNAWSDQIVRSSDATVGNADDRVLATVPHSGSLSVGNAYTSSVPV